jgi:hypothetical protein
MLNKYAYVYASISHLHLSLFLSFPVHVAVPPPRRPTVTLVTVTNGHTKQQRIELVSMLLCMNTTTVHRSLCHVACTLNKSIMSVAQAHVQAHVRVHVYTYAHVS